MTLSGLNSFNLYIDKLKLMNVSNALEYVTGSNKESIYLTKEEYDLFQLECNVRNIEKHGIAYGDSPFWVITNQKCKRKTYIRDDGKVYKNIREISEDLGVACGNISKCIRKGWRVKGYYFKFR